MPTPAPEDAQSSPLTTLTPSLSRPPPSVIAALAAEPAPGSNGGISMCAAPSLHLASLPSVPPFRRPRLDLGPIPNPLRGARVPSGPPTSVRGDSGTPSRQPPPYGPQIKSGATEGRGAAIEAGAGVGGRAGRFPLGGGNDEKKAAGMAGKRRREWRGKGGGNGGEKGADMAGKRGREWRGKGGGHDGWGWDDGKARCSRAAAGGGGAAGGRGGGARRARRAAPARPPAVGG